MIRCDKRCFDSKKKIQQFFNSAATPSCLLLGDMRAVTPTCSSMMHVLMSFRQASI